MPTIRRITFDEWWASIASGGTGDQWLPNDIAWRAWQAAADQYADRYAHFSGENCEERLKALDKAKDTSFAKMQQHLRGEVDRYAREVAIRKEVHRDDYLRSATMMAALKMIMKITDDVVPFDIKSQLDDLMRISEIAQDAVVEVWGISPTKHCDNHGSYRPSCADCRAIGRSAARGDEKIQEANQSETLLDGVALGDNETSDLGESDLASS